MSTAPVPVGRVAALPAKPQRTKPAPQRHRATCRGRVHEPGHQDVETGRLVRICPHGRLQRATPAIGDCPEYDVELIWVWRDIDRFEPGRRAALRALAEQAP